MAETKKRACVSPHLTLYMAPDDTCLSPQGPQPPHYERRHRQRNLAAQQNQKQVLLGVGVGLVCTVSLIGLLALPFLYRYFSNRKPYFADTIIVTALLTMVACLGSAVTLTVLVAVAIGFLFAHLPSSNRYDNDVYDY
jgi:hypothetical protein